MSSGRLLFFLIVSLFVMLTYAVLNMFVMDHAEKVISQAPDTSGFNVDGIQQASCDRAKERYQAVWDQAVDGGFNEAAERRLEALQHDVDRACGNN